MFVVAEPAIPDDNEEALNNCEEALDNGNRRRAGTAEEEGEEEVEQARVDVGEKQEGEEDEQEEVFTGILATAGYSDAEEPLLLAGKGMSIFDGGIIVVVIVAP